MKRKQNHHLSDDEKIRLQRDIRAGLSTQYLARVYNLTERTVLIHCAKMNGTYSKEKPKDSRDVTRDVKRICMCEDCFEEKLEGSAFCAKHDPQPPANRARLMARRA